MAAILAVVVIAVLGASTQDFRAQAVGNEAVEAALESWTEGTDLAVQSVDVRADGVTVVVTGPQPPPPVEDLGAAIEEGWERPFDTRVFWIPRETYRYDATGS